MVKLTNEQVLITLNADDFLENNGFKGNQFDLITELALESEFIFNSFITETKSNYDIREIMITTHNAIGMYGVYGFQCCQFSILSANWSGDDWEVTIKLLNYPSLFSKIFAQELYLQQLKALKSFSTIIFNSIKNSINPNELVVCLYSDPSYEVMDMELLRW